MSTFKIGMRVVCVRDDWELITYEKLPNPPKIKDEFFIHSITDRFGDIYFSFGEYGSIHWVLSEYFRPVQDQYTEAEIENVNVDELIEIIEQPEYA